MSYTDFMNSIRQWDNRASKWMMRHFYLMFFQIVLVFIFVAFFINTIKVLDVSIMVTREKIVESILLTHSINGLIIVLLLLLNSFWMLFMFNGILRIRTILRDINYNLSRKRGPN